MLKLVLLWWIFNLILLVFEIKEYYFIFKYFNKSILRILKLLVYEKYIRVYNIIYIGIVVFEIF